MGEVDKATGGGGGGGSNFDPRGNGMLGKIVDLHAKLDPTGIVGKINNAAGVGNGNGGKDEETPFYQDPGPRPIDPSMRNYINPNGELDPRMRMNPTLAQYSAGDQSSYNALKDRAMAQGPSTWANLQNQQLAQQQQNSVNNATQLNAGNQAGARANLAMHGGLTGGAAERLARGGMRDMNASRQDIANQGIQGRTQIGIADDAAKQAALGQTAGMSMQYANAQNASNAANAGIQNQAASQNQQALIDQAKQETQFGMDKYKTQMGQYGAIQSANAIGAAPAAGGKK